jgi:hypothetical protein
MFKLSHFYAIWHLIILVWSVYLLGFMLPPFHVSGSHRHTLLVGLLWVSDQLSAEAATYTTHNKHKRWTSIALNWIPCMIPLVRWLNICTLDSTATEIIMMSHSAVKCRYRYLEHDYLCHLTNGTVSEGGVFSYV